MNEQGDLLPPGQMGEIVIRGANVTPGYEKNPAANAEAFNNGWFRTGDQGIMSAEGYITITGRLKEIINRGGEKISPREVDEVLMDHPAILQVVTFAFPHDRLGEDVAAAIVLRDGASLTEKEVREFAARRLADFKVPRKVRFVAEIPKGATGKLQRHRPGRQAGTGITRAIQSPLPTSQRGRSRRAASLEARARRAKVRISGASATQPSTGSRATSRSCSRPWSSSGSSQQWAGSASSWRSPCRLAQFSGDPAESGSGTV